MKNTVLAATMLLCGMAMQSHGAVFPSFEFGAVTITSMDTVRVNVANPTSAACDGSVVFIGPDGQPLKTMAVSVRPGATQSASFSLLDVPRSVDGGSSRLAVRTNLIFPPGPCRSLIGLLELADTMSGRTFGLLLPAVTVASN
jgi:hypothetical protein